MEYKSITYMRPSSVVKKFNDGDALVCKCCNGKINPRTMQCEIQVRRLCDEGLF